MLIQALRSTFLRHNKSGIILIRRLSVNCQNLFSFSQKRPTEIMKLFTDQGNPFTLKVLSAFNIAKKNVDMEIVDRKSKL